MESVEDDLAMPRWFCIQIISRWCYTRWTPIEERRRDLSGVVDAERERWKTKNRELNVAKQDRLKLVRGLADWSVRNPMQKDAKSNPRYYEDKIEIERLSGIIITLATETGAVHTWLKKAQRDLAAGRESELTSQRETLLLRAHLPNASDSQTPTDGEAGGGGGGGGGDTTLDLDDDIDEEIEQEVTRRLKEHEQKEVALIQQRIQRSMTAEPEPRIEDVEDEEEDEEEKTKPPKVIKSVLQLDQD